MPAEEMVIRSAMIEDSLPVSCLLKQQYIEHRIDAPMEELVPAIEYLIGSPHGGQIFVAQYGSEIIGTAVMTLTWSIEHRGRIAWLDELFVVPGSRDKGVGGRLLREVVKRAEVEGCRAIELEVDFDHERAENLYMRNGFETVTRNRFVLRINQDIKDTK